jgi:hypothetical protein
VHEPEPPSGSSRSHRAGAEAGQWHQERRHFFTLTSFVTRRKILDSFSLSISWRKSHQQPSASFGYARKLSRSVSDKQQTLPEQKWVKKYRPISRFGGRKAEIAIELPSQFKTRFINTCARSGCRRIRSRPLANGKLLLLEFKLDHAAWDERRRELNVVYESNLNGERKRACEIMQFDTSGRQIGGEALYGAIVWTGSEVTRLPTIVKRRDMRRSIFGPGTSSRQRSASVTSAFRSQECH